MVNESNQIGLRDWFVQRVTALLIGTYAIFFIIYLLATHPLSQQQWFALSSNIVFRIWTLLVVLSILWHAWIGLWTVFTDYVKHKGVRMVLQTLVCLLLLGYLAWTLEILWLAR